jgi:hypothetical protein
VTRGSFTRDSGGGNPRPDHRCLTGGIGPERQHTPGRAEGRRGWVEGVSRWARNREAEIGAMGFSPWRAVQRARVTFHLAFRGASRLWIGMERTQLGRLTPAAVAACAVWDVVQARRLHADPRLRLAPRLAADVADVAAWSGLCDRAYPAVPTIGIPLVTETAFRYQWAAAPLVLAHLGAVAVARRLAGKPLQLLNVGHQGLGLVVGLGLRRVERAGVERVRARDRKSVE